MKTLCVCPALLLEGYRGYSPAAIKTLFNGTKVSPFLDFDYDDFCQGGEIEAAAHRISVSGVQEKFPAIIKDGKICIATSDERSTHILKPTPWDKTLRDRVHIPANEHLTMQIATQIYGIHTAANGLCFTASGHPVYITRRFDIMSDGNKIPMEDLASVVGRNEQIIGTHFKYTGSYEDIAIGLKRNIAAWMIDMERFFELLVFNYIYANGDAHMKNFSLILNGEDFRLAPAYDLLNTSLHLDGDDFGLDKGLSSDIEKSDIFDRTAHPCRLDFERFGLKIGLLPGRISRILNKYTRLPESSAQLVENSFLSEKMKRNYLRIVNERISRFVRESE